ncbi:hypothetical protein L0F63_001443 [Massospora cicadina]|nr:hypothetical protein L0F63_001443 [Massospora cicadina]
MGGYLAHMEMVYPTIPKSKYNELLQWYEKDYTNMFPIGNQYYQDFPFCHHPMEDEVGKPVEAGATLTTRFAGDAPHDGGHCEFSISYDGKEYAVIKTILSKCLRNGVMMYDITIPQSAPSGRAILSWTWFNRIGEREIYMNCAALDIKGGPASGMIFGPKRLIANLPNFPTIHQFKYSIKGVHLFRNRNTVETGIGSDGTPTRLSLKSTSLPYPAEITFTIP